MNASLRTLLATASVLWLVLLGVARADVALDYQSQVAGCASADRFADEVAAKLGFVPWDPQAATTMRVRITRDGRDVVGTVEQPDGASKVLRATSCPKLGEALVTAAAVALDRPARAAVSDAAAPRDERRLKRLEREPAQDLVTVNLSVRDGRALEISRILSTTFVAGYNYSGVGISFTTLCAPPCKARLPAGAITLMLRDVASGATVRKEVVIDRDASVEIDYTSRAATRQRTASRIKWGLVVGFLAGTVASALYIESQTDSRVYHILDPSIGLVTGLIGGTIGGLMGPGMPHDDAVLNVRPGLAPLARF